MRPLTLHIEVTLTLSAYSACKPQYKYMQMRAQMTKPAVHDEVSSSRRDHESSQLVYSGIGWVSSENVMQQAEECAIVTELWCTISQWSGPCQNGCSVRSRAKLHPNANETTEARQACAKPTKCQDLAFDQCFLGLIQIYSAFLKIFFEQLSSSRLMCITSAFPIQFHISTGVLASHTLSKWETMRTRLSVCSH